MLGSSDGKGYYAIADSSGNLLQNAATYGDSFGKERLTVPGGQGGAVEFMYFGVIFDDGKVCKNIEVTDITDDSEYTDGWLNVKYEDYLMNYINSSGEYLF